MKISKLIAVGALGCAALVGVGSGVELGRAQDEKPAAGLPKGPTWGRGRFRPRGSNTVFATGDGCALCHSAAPRASALRSPAGDDLSPFGLWQGTMMANAFRDPYWRAQVAREGLANPDAKVEIEALCLRCHGPMVHHSARLGGTPSPSIAEAAKDPLAQDGVSCTVCHQTRPDGLGEPKTFGGQLDIRTGRVIFGPYADPVSGPMRMHSAFEPTQGEHIREAGLCAGCHTLETSPGKGHPKFVEQAPFLEWSNSVYAQPGEASRTCQECHMMDAGTMRIARNPGGRDFNMASRPDVKAHTFVGGNTVVLAMLRKYRDELGVVADDDALRRTEIATRRQLREDSARLDISAPKRASGRLSFDVNVTNLTGHKLPTGYPSRRAWLRIQVRAGRSVLFSVGDYEANGRLRGVKDERAVPHRSVVRSSEDVVVYEAVPVDLAGKPTTLLTGMAKMAKDSRLLPLGWKPDGAYAKRTAPVGTADDGDFIPGSDTVHVDVALPKDAPQGLLVVVWLLYQPIPPTWVDPLRAVDAPEAKQFVRFYDELKPSPETMALKTRREGE